MKTRNAYFILASLALLMMLFLHLFLDLLPFVERTFDDLEDRHKEQLRILIERSKLVSGLASAVFGVAGGLLLKLGQRATAGMRRLAIYVFILAGSSLLFGYLSFSEVIWMLDSEFFNLYSGPVRIPFDAQFIFFLGAVLVLGHFFLTASRHVDSTTSPSPSPGTTSTGSGDSGGRSDHKREHSSGQTLVQTSPRYKYTEPPSASDQSDPPRNEPWR